jgi:hypothetical protein
MVNRGWAAKVREKLEVSKLDAGSPDAFNIARPDHSAQGIR